VATRSDAPLRKTKVTQMANLTVTLTPPADWYCPNCDCDLCCAVRGRLERSAAKTETGIVDSIGWFKLSNASKWHYFNGSKSLCGKWMYLGAGPFEADDKPRPTDCGACRRKLEAGK
jgi:hypothetical protein